MTTKKLNETEQAREVVQAHFVAMLQSMLQLGLTPEKMLSPWMEQGAALFATVKMRRGDQAPSLETVATDFKLEAGRAIQRILNAGNPSALQ